jgi:hypothetical protein
MFRDAGNGFKIYCDYEAGKIRVQEDASLNAGLVGYKPMWSEVASFQTIEEWEQSKYARRIDNEQVEEMITWFWIDMTSSADKAR